MNHFDKIAAALPKEGLDAVLLTGEYNRFYASGFASTGADGVALVTISARLDHADVTPDELVVRMRETDGVVSAELLAG